MGRSLLSPTVQWIDIDPDQWINFWTRFYAHKEHWLIGIQNGGEPFALVDSERGQLPLDSWPSLRTAQRSAIVERDDLERLWHEQQAMFDPADDYDTYAVNVADSTRAFIEARMIAGTQRPAIRYAVLTSLLHDRLGDNGSFLLTVHHDDHLWWSLAGRLRDAQIDILTSSQGLLDPGASPEEPTWTDTHRRLANAAVQRLGIPLLGLAVQLDRFDDVIRSDSPWSVLRTAIENGQALIEERNQ